MNDETRAFSPGSAVTPATSASVTQADDNIRNGEAESYRVGYAAGYGHGLADLADKVLATLTGPDAPVEVLAAALFALTGGPQ